MQLIFEGEQNFKSGKRIKLTSDRDCLSPQTMRMTERVFPDNESIKTYARLLSGRGFHVCIDTEEVFEEWEPYSLEAQ